MPTMKRIRGVVALAALVQGFHAVEHVAQVAQRMVLLDRTPHGFLGESVDFEWLHFGYNLALAALLAAIFLFAGLHRPGARERMPLFWWAITGALVIEVGLHLPEHIVRLYQYLEFGWDPPPGVLGRTPFHGQGPFDVLVLHAVYNAAVAILLVAATVGLARPGLVLFRTERGARRARWVALSAASLLAARCVGEPPMMGQGMDTSEPVGVVYPTGAVPGCEPMDGDGVLSVVAVGLKFEPGCLAATANQPFTLDLENRDAGTRHNLSIYAGPRMYAVNAPNMFRGSVIEGPARHRDSVPGLPPGTWQFLCDIHSEIMVGVFNVPVEVGGAGFVPDRVELPQGLSLSFLFAEDGSGPHAVTDASGVYGGQGGILDSGEQPVGALFSFKFVAAGSYGLVDPPTGHRGFVEVPVSVEPSKGEASDRFRVSWSRFPLRGFVHDVQIRRPGTTSFQAWLSDTEEFEGSFEPDSGPGTYAFRARLRAADGTTTGWSPIVELAVDR